MAPLFDLLPRILKEPACIVGVGNPLRGDDGIGPYLVDRLAEAELPGHLSTLQVEDIPESYVFDLARRQCRHVVFADAVVGAGEKGAVLFGRFRELGDTGDDWSTHRLALNLCAEILEASGKSVWLLGIAASDTTPGNRMQPELTDTADRLGDLLIRWAKGEIHR